MSSFELRKPGTNEVVFSITVHGNPCFHINYDDAYNFTDASWHPILKMAETLIEHTADKHINQKSLIAVNSSLRRELNKLRQTSGE